MKTAMGLFTELDYLLINYLLISITTGVRVIGVTLRDPILLLLLLLSPLLMDDD